MAFVSIVAHRGNAPGFVENTRAAFAHALTLPIHGVECDVRLTKDGRVVVHHDHTVDRLSDGSGPVGSYTLDQLRQLNFGTEKLPQQILTLGELLAMIRENDDKHLYLEIKEPSRTSPALENAVLNELSHQQLMFDPRIHIITFSRLAVRRVKRLAPHLDTWFLRTPRAAMLHPRDPVPRQVDGLGLSIQTARQRPKLVGAHGVPTYLWTVNDEAGMRHARTLGVDVLATDAPELALKVLSAHEAKKSDAPVISPVDQQVRD